MSLTVKVRTSTTTVTIKSMKFNPTKHTVYDIKKAYCDEHDATKDPQKIAFRVKGMELKPNSATLVACNIKENARILMVSMSSKLRGGGGPSVPGPNLNSELYKGKWTENAPKYRCHCRGLNIGFKYDGKNVIGQIGYTTDKNVYRQGHFNVAKHYKKAYCPALKVYCPNLDSIATYWFNDCKVVFEGELKINETKYFGDQPCKFLGGNLEYGWLEMTVTKS